MKNYKFSKSEDNGINAIRKNDKKILSVGISTAGIAEIRMVKDNPDRKIIATTIDKKGAAFARKFIKQEGFEDNIEVRIEDVSKPSPYEDNYFDFVYARLVLHYLPKEKLISALNELYRVLKRKGRLYIVVRSDKCPQKDRKGATYNSDTGITRYPTTHFKSGEKIYEERFFHSEKSITKFTEDAGFRVIYAKSYDEQIYKDFKRTVPSRSMNNLIELLAEK